MNGDIAGAQVDGNVGAAFPVIPRNLRTHQEGSARVGVPRVCEDSRIPDIGIDKNAVGAGLWLVHRNLTELELDCQILAAAIDP